MDLVRDVLDKAVVDRQERELGRVDGIVLSILPGEPPRVAAIEIGPAVLAWRVRPFLGRAVAALEFLFAVDKGRPERIEFGGVLDVSDAIKVDREWPDTSATLVERRLRRWVGRIPGAS
jgi:hypothetical protein